MFNWLRKIIYDLSVEKQRSEIASWLSNLKALNSDEVGMIAAMACHTRNGFLNGTGIDVADPFLYGDKMSDVVMRLHGAINEMQKSGNAGAASGLIVWLFTARCALAPDLRNLGRQLWKELSRGFPHIEESALAYRVLTGTSLNLIGAGTFPSGFEPEPI